MKLVAAHLVFTVSAGSYDAGCHEYRPYAFDLEGEKDGCCKTKPVPNASDPSKLDCTGDSEECENGPNCQDHHSVWNDPRDENGCTDMFPHAFPMFGEAWCCQNEPTDAPDYSSDYHMYCSGDGYVEYIESRHACPENHPYAGDDNAPGKDNNFCCSELHPDGKCDFDYDYSYCNNRVTVNSFGTPNERYYECKDHHSIGEEDAAPEEAAEETDEAAEDEFPKYLGCFIDSANEDMGTPEIIDGKTSSVSLSDNTRNGVSIATCFEHCKKEGFLYFGMMYGGACRCSNTYGSKGEGDGCTMSCFQASWEIPPYDNKCGGPQRNSVYQIKEKEKTHCPESHPFVYDYFEDEDACCTEEVGDDGYGGEHCGGDYVYCDNKGPCQDHPSVVEEEEEERNGCPDTHPHVYGYNYEGEFCCSHEPYDGPNGDYCMDDPVLDHPDFVKPEKEVCPSSHPHPYDYYGNNDYCCPHDPAQNPDTDFCVDDSNEMIGQACPNPPCESHPSAVDGGKEETPEPAVGELSCPQCWTLNADRTSCVLSDTTCFELSCDSATLSFAFFPKMFGQSDLSHNFGVTGLEANSARGQFKYSKGLGTNGQTVVVDGDEMVFSISLSTSAREERLIEEKVVDGSKLVVQTGKLQFGKLEVDFQCRVPLVTEVQSDLFTVNSDDEVKNKQLAGDKLISLTGDLAPTFSLDLFKDAAYLEAISASNLKLGDIVYFTIKWSNTENDQVQFFAQDCQIVDGLKEVAIIKDTCLASVVETTRLGTRHNKEELKFSYKSFAVDSMPASSSKTQTLKCSLKLCKNADCLLQMKNTVDACPSVSGFTYIVA